jgi:uncharacterized protein YkwD
MKIFYRTLVFLFFALTLFVLRDDIVLVIDKASFYLNGRQEKIALEKLENKEVELSAKINTPGALKVIGNLLNATSSAKLSRTKIIELTNQYRKENGNLPELKENPNLDLSADKKLQDMFDNQYFEHVSPGGASVGDLAKEAGYEYILIGENLAMGTFKDDSSLVAAWMASEGHRKNILNGHYTEIGVAVSKGNFEGQNIWMAVEHFGTPRNVCPSIDRILLGVINLNQYKVKEMEEDLLKRREMIDKGVVYEGSTHTEQIEEYNSLVTPYNNLIKEIGKQIEDYNNQIRAFNSCLSKLE